jgi:hypothetical protein
MGFIWRWLFAFLLLAATFNPTEYDYVDWVRDYGARTSPLPCSSACCC